MIDRDYCITRFRRLLSIKNSLDRREVLCAQKSQALFITPVALFLSVSSPAGSQTKNPATLAELAAYTGADWDQLLLVGARVEGKVLRYTSLAGASFKEPMKAFEAKYPGVKVEVYRSQGSDLGKRITTENQAKEIL